MLRPARVASCVLVPRTRMDHYYRAIYWLQIATTVILLEMALWSSGTRQHLTSLTALLWVILTSIFPRHTARELGLGAQGFRRSFWFIPLSSAIAALFVCAAWQIGTLHPAFGAKAHSYTYLAYAIWAVIQQFILQSYLFIRFESLLASGRRAVVACAALFAFVHIPNPVLTVATFAGGLAFCEMFRRYRNLYSLGIAHALLGISVAVSIPSALHHDMRVGLGFLHPPIPNAAVSDVQERDAAQPLVPVSR